MTAIMQGARFINFRDMCLDDFPDEEAVPFHHAVIMQAALETRVTFVDQGRLYAQGFSQRQPRRFELVRRCPPAYLKGRKRSVDPSGLVASTASDCGSEASTSAQMIERLADPGTRHKIGDDLARDPAPETHRLEQWRLDRIVGVDPASLSTLSSRAFAVIAWRRVSREVSARQDLPTRLTSAVDAPIPLR
jgi:hypothetical protein